MMLPVYGYQLVALVEVDENSPDLSEYLEQGASLVQDLFPALELSEPTPDQYMAALAGDLSALRPDDALIEDGDEDGG